jgi:hypothetical protein
MSDDAHLFLAFALWMLLVLADPAALRHHWNRRKLYWKELRKP